MAVTVDLLRAPLSWETHEAAKLMVEIGAPTRAILSVATEGYLHGQADDERCISLKMMGLLKADAAEVVPLLVEALKEDTLVRLFAAEALADLGPAAKAAVPALLEVAQAPGASTRWNAIDALKRIDPEAVKKAGLP